MEICSLNGQCGGCLYQGVPYEEQVLLKGEEVRKIYRRKENEDRNGTPASKVSPAIYRYRNKMEYTFGNLEKGGEMTLGMHKRGQYMTILNVDDCQLVHEDFNIIVRAVLDFCRGREYRYYHKKRSTTA